VLWQRGRSVNDCICSTRRPPHAPWEMGRVECAKYNAVHSASKYGQVSAICILYSKALSRMRQDIHVCSTYRIVYLALLYGLEVMRLGMLGKVGMPCRTLVHTAATRPTMVVRVAATTSRE
jgi:hypothetical protein